MNYKDYEYLTHKSIRTKLKAPDRVSHLKYLNEMTNDYYGKVLFYIFGSINKIIPVCVKTNEGDYSYYGHLNSNEGGVIRLSTCLDLNNSIQIPISEVEYMKRGGHIFFTCGDIFLIVYSKNLGEDIIKKRLPVTATKCKNYEIFVSDLFKLDLVKGYGFIDFDTKEVYYNDSLSSTVPLSLIILPEIFYKTTLRGCTISFKPKYILARIENSDSKDYFEYNCYMTRAAVLHELSFTGCFKTIQGVGNIAKVHTEAYIREQKILKPIKRGPFNTYVLLKMDNISIEDARLFCMKQMKEERLIEKSYSLQWAVKKAFYCRSSEEYNYYRNHLLNCLGKQKKYSLTEIGMLKDMYPVTPYKYQDGARYTLYTRNFK